MQQGIHRGKIQYNQLIQSTNYSNYQFIKLDLNDGKHLNQLFEREKVDKVINLAAQAGVRYSLVNPQAYVESNILGFVNLLECCRHFDVKHLVYASSSSVYGLNEKIPLSTADNVDHPVSLYAASKKSNELMAHAYSHLFNLPTTGIRFFTVSGPWGRPDMAYFLFTDAILNDKPIKVFNHGKMLRDFTYIYDIVEGIYRIVKSTAKGSENWNGFQPSPAISKAPYKVYNIGNNRPYALLEFIHTLEKAIGKTAKKIMLPMQPGDVVATYADVSELVEELGYKPDTDLSYGIQQFVDWYLSYYQNASQAIVETTPKTRVRAVV